MNATDRSAHRAAVHAGLLAGTSAADGADDPARPLFASLLAGSAAGRGILPEHLGLGRIAFAAMLARFFPGHTAAGAPRVIQRIPEWNDLCQLLIDHRAGRDEDVEFWLARIVATGCAGANHLWEDLGLASRDELSALMRLAFPALAAANDRDMKWKKFLYRQYCARDGIYVCPAPSCGVCKDFTACFGSEN